jgi:xylulokinase
MEAVSPFFFGYDLGSHGAKGALFDLSGRMIASASRSHTISRPAPGWQEQDPGKLWWTEFLEISGELTNTLSLSRERAAIAGIGITGFVPGLCALDGEGVPVRPAIMHTDLRAGGELAEVNALLPEPLTLGTLLPKLLWIRNNEPESYAAIAKVLVPHAWLVYRLTGRMVCDYDSASIYGGLFDTVRLEWDRGICRTLDIDPSLFPEPVPVTACVGTLSPEASDLLSISPSARVIAGSGDSFAALAGEGAVNPGDLMIYLGTSATSILVEAPFRDFAGGPHYGEGRASFVGRIFSCGESMEHYRSLLGHGGWKELDGAASETPPGSGGLMVFPHLKQRGDGDSGMLDRESIVGLETNHGQGHLFRAFLEGVAYQLRDDYEHIEERVGRVLLAGGGARSGVFCSIIASTLDRTVLTTPGGGGAAGMALLAAWSLGYTDSPDKLADRWFSRRIEHRPDPETAEMCRESFAAWKEIRSRIEAVHRLIDR